MLTLKLSDMGRCEGGETDNGSCYKFKIPLLLDAVQGHSKHRFTSLMHFFLFLVIFFMFLQHRDYVSTLSTSEMKENKSAKEYPLYL